MSSSFKLLNFIKPRQKVFSGQQKISKTSFNLLLRPPLYESSDETISFTHDIAIVPKNSYKAKIKLSGIGTSCIRHVFTRAGLDVVETKGPLDGWSLNWGRPPLSERRELAAFQTVNHFVNTLELGRKSNLSKNLNSFQEKFGEKLSFAPKTFLLPTQIREAKEYLQHENIMILKPQSSSRGRGVRVVDKNSAISVTRKSLLQQYIPNPLLVNGKKFDMRLYVLVSNAAPLTVYIFPKGIVRFAVANYDAASKDPAKHITNYSITKDSDCFSEAKDDYDINATKCSTIALWEYLRKHGVDIDPILAKIRDLVMKTVLSAESYFYEEYACSQRNCYRVAHELFGFDIMLDDSYNPWLIEVNTSPSTGTKTDFDKRLKYDLVSSVYDLVGLNLNLRQVNKKVTKNDKIKLFNKCPKLKSMNLSDAELYKIIQFDEEMHRANMFELIYPTIETIPIYSKYFPEPRRENELIESFLMP